MSERIFPNPSTCPVPCNSWVVTTKDGCTFETFDEDVARAAFKDNAIVKTAYDHLIEFNKSLKK